MKKIHRILLEVSATFLISAAILIPADPAWGQANGSVPPEATGTSTASSTPAQATSSATAAPATGTVPSRATSTATPAQTAPRPVPVPVPAPPSSTATLPAAEPVAADPASEPVANEATDRNVVIGLVALGVLGFLGGYAALKAKKSGEKEEEEGGRCFDIKKLLDGKLEELTDFRGQIREGVRGKVEESLDGTRAGEILAKIKQAEREYERLKKLYEECLAEIDRSGSLVFGTTNPAKILQIRGVLKPLNVTVVGLPEKARSLNVIEDGATAPENARKKAVAYAKEIGEPVLSMDNALFLDGLPPGEQPGIHVRRIGGTSERPSDDDLRRHYAALVARLGGRVSARSEFALCYARPDGTVAEKTIISPRIFVSTPSEKMIAGYPLESLQIDQETGKYISEMSQEEQDRFWQRAIGAELISFIKSIR